MKEILRQPVPGVGGRAKDNYCVTLFFDRPTLVGHDRHAGYGGFLLRESRDARFKKGQFLMVAYVDRRWTEIGRSGPRRKRA